MNKERSGRILQKLAARSGFFGRLFGKGQKTIDKGKKTVSEVGEAVKERAGQVTHKGRPDASATDRIAGQVGGWPVRSVGRVLRNIVAGSPVPGRSALKSRTSGFKILKGNEIDKAKVKGLPIHKIKIDGKNRTVTPTFRPGGLLGVAAKHPVLTAGGVVGGGLLLKARANRPNINIYNRPQEAQPQVRTEPEFINWG